MKSEMDSYNQLLDRLRKTEPEIKSEKILTDQIMLHIRNNKRQNSPATLIWIRTISSAAAIFLLGLFSYQYIGENQTYNTDSYQKTLHHIKITETCFSENEIVSLSEKYTCYLQHKKNRKNNFQAFSKHLKSFKYENID
jgi:hypothetical protein